MEHFSSTFKSIILLKCIILFLLAQKYESAAIDRNSVSSVKMMGENDREIDREIDASNIFRPVNITVSEAKDDGVAAEVVLDDLPDSGIREEEEDFRPIPIPRDFSSYDIWPPDGFISLQELVTVTGAEENAEQALEDADSNGDGHLSKEEFYKGMFTHSANSNQ